MFKFNWNVLKQEHASTAEDVLNATFAGIKRPDVVGDIVVHDIVFGAEPPEVEVTEISALSPQLLYVLSQHDIFKTTTDSDNDSKRNTSQSITQNGSDRKQQLHETVHHPTVPVPHVDDQDAQIAVRLTYNGSAAFSISTELIVNWPAPGFARLPITVRIKDLHLDGVAMLLHYQKQMFFTFANDGHAIGPLRNITLDAEIGDANQSVLTSIDKVEHFIVSELQRLIRTHAVFPNVIHIPQPDKSPDATESDAKHAAEADHDRNATNKTNPRHSRSRSKRKSRKTPNRLSTQSRSTTPAAAAAAAVSSSSDPRDIHSTPSSQLRKRTIQR
jgi:hypothetical protein